MFKTVPKSLNGSYTSDNARLGTLVTMYNTPIGVLTKNGWKGHLQPRHSTAPLLIWTCLWKSPQIEPEPELEPGGYPKNSMLCEVGNFMRKSSTNVFLKNFPLNDELPAGTKPFGSAAEVCLVTQQTFHNQQQSQQHAVARGV